MKSKIKEEKEVTRIFEKGKKDEPPTLTSSAVSTTAAQASIHTDGSRSHHAFSSHPIVWESSEYRQRNKTSSLGHPIINLISGPLPARGI